MKGFKEKMVLQCKLITDSHMNPAIWVEKYAAKFAVLFDNVEIRDYQEIKRRLY